MLGALTDKLQSVFSHLGKEKKITENSLKEAIKEIRLALLEADVNYQVAKKLIVEVKERSLGQSVIKSVSPAQKFTKIVHDELVKIMGGERKENSAPISFQSPLTVLMLCGLQGAGKTTHAAKLAFWSKKNPHQKKPLLVACDLQRPAAVQQLQILGEKASVPLFSLPGEKDPCVVAGKSLQYAREHDYDFLIVDTAGRLHIDEELMLQLAAIKREINPHEVIFVANSMLGQDAVKSAALFHERVGMTGTILSMLDGNARGGAAISIQEVTGTDLKFEGVGEKLEDLQSFSPTSMADRILGMGDVINLVKRAEEKIDHREAEKLSSRIIKAEFSYHDFLLSLQMLRKMGPLQSIMKMVPGVANMGNFAVENVEGPMKLMESMIHSMTPQERKGDHLSMSMRERISRGSGVPLHQVNQMIKKFTDMKQTMKKSPVMKQLTEMVGKGKFF